MTRTGTGGRKNPFMYRITEVGEQALSIHRAANAGGFAVVDTAGNQEQHATAEAHADVQTAAPMNFTGGVNSGPSEVEEP